jgi:hypothetical protein
MPFTLAWSGSRGITELYTLLAWDGMVYHGKIWASTGKAREIKDSLA